MPVRLDWTCLGLSAVKRPPVRPHLGDETNESSGCETSEKRNVHVYEAKRPGGETSICMGRIVQGRNVQGAKIQAGVKRLGGETARGETSINRHRRHEQDKTCCLLVRIGGVNTIGDKTRQLCLVSTEFRWVLSFLDLVSNLQLCKIFKCQSFL